MLTIQKYPRTQHIEGSRPQPGDEDLKSVPFATLAGRYLVVEEKLDGANAGICFDEAGQLRLQSRGHFNTVLNLLETLPNAGVCVASCFVQ